MQKVKAKKHLGQHFLTDLSIAKKIVDSLSQTSHYKKVVEVGPGMGVLTQYLIEHKEYETFPVDVDRESIGYLVEKYPQLKGKIIYADFLKVDLNELIADEPFAVIGNFPYNISTQILFKVLDYKDQIPEVVGMFQKEVAERFASKPGSKIYGITSVLLQAFYDVEYLFTVGPEVFDPPPKVQSAVIRFVRNEKMTLDCDEKRFKTIVKMAFGQRRKMMRKSLKSLLNDSNKDNEILTQRPEQLSVKQFVELTNLLIEQ
ncbi:MAG: 16S rRNA (adenine(1518)-N(6)/adenine(1519)-N(6))-dimethyltransferase RsmA [Flavobacteriales bacterium]|nr:16S rRNA (adenine(1518)-N(6)/adenine(1519)-N(6))-dimethyltransferase RsmA [Flavobacteriales bacterium]